MKFNGPLYGFVFCTVLLVEVKAVAYDKERQASLFVGHCIGGAFRGVVGLTGSACPTGKHRTNESSQDNTSTPGPSIVDDSASTQDNGRVSETRFSAKARYGHLFVVGISVFLVLFDLFDVLLYPDLCFDWVRLEWLCVGLILGFLWTDLVLWRWYPHKKGRGRSTEEIRAMMFATGCVWATAVVTPDLRYQNPLKVWAKKAERWGKRIDKAEKWEDMHNRFFK